MVTMHVHVLVDGGTLRWGASVAQCTDSRGAKLAGSLSMYGPVLVAERLEP